MPSGIASRHAVNPRSNPFTHSTDIDPNILAVPPHDPYSLLAPGNKIQAGDIKRLVGEGQQWLPVEDHEIDYDVPARGCAYARAEAPENYFVAPREKIVSPGALVWTSQTSDWQSVEQYPEILGRAVGELVDEFQKTHNQLLFIAERDPAAPAHQVLDVPPRHRQLYPGERLRRGDKLIFEGRTEWLPVTLDAFGRAVEMPGASNGQARFCRPVGPNFQNWYVDPVKGQENNMGGAADPWPSVEFAEKTIEAACKNVSVPPHGIIWSGGVPKMVYDLPEQPERVLVTQGDPQMAAIMEEEDNRVLAAVQKGAEEAKTPSEEAAAEPKPREPRRRIPARPPESRYVAENVNTLAQRLECTAEEVREDATRQLPRGFRLMSGREEVGKGDLLYQLDEALETATWKPAPADLAGSLVGDGDEMPLFARRTVSKASARELLARARQQHIELGDTLAELATILNQQ